MSVETTYDETANCTITIKFDVKKVVFHEGDGSRKSACSACCEKPKRYYIVYTTDRNRVFLCRDCYNGPYEYEGSDDDYDSYDDY